MDTGYPATFWEARKGIQGPAPTSTDQTLWHESWEGSEAGVPLGQHTCEACGQPQHMPRGESHWSPAAQDPWVPVRIPHRRVMPTRPLTTFPCLSFPRVLTRARLDTLAGRGQPGRGTPSPEQPLAPSPHTGAAAARPRRRHVLSPVECAKSLPDVHGGQSDPPPLPPGQPPGTGDPRAQHRGTEPITSRTLPGHGAQPRPVPWRRGTEARQCPGSSGWQGAAGATRTGVAVSPSH